MKSILILTFVLFSLDAISADWTHNEGLGIVMCSLSMFDQMLRQKATKVTRGTLMPSGAVNTSHVQPHGDFAAL
jgi:hypothetical protein